MRLTIAVAVTPTLACPASARGGKVEELDVSGREPQKQGDNEFILPDVAESQAAK